MNDKPTLLLVDDETINIDLLADILAEEYDLRVALNGEQALKLLARFAIDLVLLDVRMPGPDGYTVARRIRSDAAIREIPILFLTSQNDEHSIVRGFEAGANDYLIKPFNPQELKVRVANHLRMAELQKTVRAQERFLSYLLDSQPTMVVVTDAVELQFANRTVLDFFGCDTVETFRSRHRCICHGFIQKKGFFDLEQTGEHPNWVVAMQHLPPEKRIVALISHRDFTEHAFSVSINRFDAYYVVDFHDISQTMSRQLELIEQSEHDPLTHAFNRTYLHRNFDSIVRRRNAADERTAVVMMDIDHFKRVNDTHGHGVGDAVLVKLVALIGDHLRSSDVLVRWGGEEFLIVLGVHDSQSLHKVLDTLRRLIEAETFETVGTITCSFGGTLLEPFEPLGPALQRADKALYDSKAGGRNRVTVVPAQDNLRT